VTARQEALTELVSRLSSILTTNGYQTDAGAQVFILEDPALGEDDGPAAIAVVVGADQIQWQGEQGLRRPAGGDPGAQQERHRDALGDRRGRAGGHQDGG
jgi:hypothetical protein